MKKFIFVLAAFSCLTLGAQTKKKAKRSSKSKAAAVLS